MSPREEAIEAAMRALQWSKIRAIFGDLYDAGYKAGDLDRQRFERSIVKPKRAAKGKR